MKLFIFFFGLIITFQLKAQSADTTITGSINNIELEQILNNMGYEVVTDSTLGVEEKKVLIDLYKKHALPDLCIVRLPKGFWIDMKKKWLASKKD